MATHKRATDVSVVPAREESELHELVEKYWKTAAIAAALLVGVFVYRHYASAQARAAHHSSWDTFRATIDTEALGFLPQLPAAEQLAGTAAGLGDTPAGAWARALEVKRRLDDGDFAGAESAAAQLRKDFPGHALVAEPLRLDPSAEPQSVVAFLEGSAKARQAWRQSRASLFTNPPLAEGSPRVRVVTSAGSFVLGLDRERAPAHVENLLNLAASGYYNGTKFHRIVPGFMIQGGDPNSKEGAPETWGQGGPDHKLAPEASGLRHFAWVLSTAKEPGATEESGSQFFVTVAPAHHLDGQHTVFGVVTEGVEVVRAISEAPRDASGERPVDPVTIERVEVL